MSETPFMPLWVNDFIGDTLELDAKEVGAYMLLLMSMWQRGGTLPADETKLRRVARVGRDWGRVWAAIGGYFVTENGVISNPRLTKELHKVDTKRRVNSQNGSLGGLAKALKDKEARLANATVSPYQPEPEPEPEPLKRETKVSPKRGTRLPEDWTLPRAWGEWAMSEGYPENLIRSEAEKFRDYWIAVPGQRGSKLDWLATWRNWMRRNGVKVINGGNNAKPSKQSEWVAAFIEGAGRT